MNEQELPPDLQSAELREMTHEEAQALSGLAAREAGGIGFDPRRSPKNHFEYNQLIHKLRWVREERFVTAHTRVFLSLILSKHPGDPILWAWTLRNIYQDMYKADQQEEDPQRTIVGLDDWAWYFSQGVPKEDEKRRIWNETSDRLEDQTIWPIEGFIIEEA